MKSFPTPDNPMKIQTMIIQRLCAKLALFKQYKIRTMTKKTSFVV